jgi:hypothetical protein
LNVDKPQGGEGYFSHSFCCYAHLSNSSLFREELNRLSSQNIQRNKLNFSVNYFLKWNKNS